MAQKKGKPFRTNKKGPIKLWVSRNEIVYISGKVHKKMLDSIIEPGQWLLTFYYGRNACVPSFGYERGRYS